MEVRDSISEISEIASKESSFEKIIQKMKSEWKSMKFTLLLYRDTQCSILSDLDLIFEKLDEDITKIMSIV